MMEAGHDHEQPGRKGSVMNTFGLIGLIIAVVLVALLIYAATKPDTFEVARSATFKATPERIFPLINDLAAFNTWNPFLKFYPATKVTYSGPGGGNGAAHAWEGNSQVGKGNIQIIESHPPTQVAMKLTMIKPMRAENRVVFTLAPNGGVTTVTWAMTGPSPYLSKLMGLVISMDKMVGGSFEKGLSDLKDLAET
jgi:uncharacterized protein YndB with AHSA1/START domain